MFKKNLNYNRDVQKYFIKYINLLLPTLFIFLLSFYSNILMASDEDVDCSNPKFGLELMTRTSCFEKSNYECDVIRFGNNFKETTNAISFAITENISPEQLFKMSQSNVDINLVNKLIKEYNAKLAEINVATWAKPSSSNVESMNQWRQRIRTVVETEVNPIKKQIYKAFGFSEEDAGKFTKSPEMVEIIRSWRIARENSMTLDRSFDVDKDKDLVNAWNKLRARFPNINTINPAISSSVCNIKSNGIIALAEFFNRGAIKKFDYRRYTTCNKLDFSDYDALTDDHIKELVNVDADDNCNYIVRSTDLIYLYSSEQKKYLSSDKNLCKILMSQMENLRIKQRSLRFN